MENPAKISVILRPRHFGKSLALSLLRTYFDYRHFPGPGFKLLKINNEENDEFFEQHAQQYAVIVLDWKAGGVLRASSFEDFKSRLRGYLQSVFLDQINILQQSLKDVISWFEQPYTSRDYKPSNFFDDRSLVASVKLLAALTYFMASVSERNVIVLVDDYDDVLAKAGELAQSAEEYREIERFFEDFYYETIEKNSAARICLFGVHKLANSAPFSKIISRRTWMVTFHEHSNDNEPFSRDFGFETKEAEDAMKVLNVSGLTSHELNQQYQLQWGGKRDMLHPYDTAAAIKYGSIDDYWVKKAPLNFAAYPFSRNEAFGIGDMLMFASHFHRIKYANVAPLPISYDPSAKVGAGHVLQYMLEEGFLRPHLSMQLTKELCDYLDVAWIHWLDLSIGITDAMRELFQHNTEPIRIALEKLKTIPFFYQGLPFLDSKCRLLWPSLFDGLMQKIFRVSCNFFDEFALVSTDDDPHNLLFVYLGVLEMNDMAYKHYIEKQTEVVRRSRQYNNGKATITIIVAVILQNDGSVRITKDQILPRLKRS